MKTNLSSRFTSVSKPSSSGLVCSGKAEPFCTIPQAAKRLGIPVSTLRRAVKTGLVPHYRPLSNRIRVRLSEVEAAILAQGEGQNDGK